MIFLIFVVLLCFLLTVLFLFLCMSWVRMSRGWNVRNEDGILRVRQTHRLSRVSKPKQVGECQHVDQAPHLFGDVLHPIQCIFRKGRIHTEFLRQFCTHFNTAIHDRLKRASVECPYCRIDLREAVAHAEKQLCRMTLFGIHFLRLCWHLPVNVGVRVVKRVFVVPASDMIHLLQCLDCARKLAQMNFGQNASNVGIGRVQSGQDGSLIASMTTHGGGNTLGDDSVVGSGIGTKVGKHCYDFFF